MSNAAFDTDNLGDADLEYVAKELENDMAKVSYYQSWADSILAATTLQDAKALATRLHSRLKADHDMLQGELMRIRQPDS